MTKSSTSRTLSSLNIKPTSQRVDIANIIFCKEGTKIHEIKPKFVNDYEINISNRYKNISNLLNLSYSSIEAESVQVEKHSLLAKKYISKKILNESNYYKNIIIKLNKLDNL